MAKVELSIAINRSPDEVFASIIDVERASEWQEGLLEAHTSPGGPLRIGTRIIEVRRVMGRRQTFVGEVVAYDPDKHTYTGRTITGPFPAQGRWSVAATEGGSRVTIVEEAHPRGVMRLMDPMISRLFTKALTASLQNLKRIMEAETASSRA